MPRSRCHGLNKSFPDWLFTVELIAPCVLLYPLEIINLPMQEGSDLHSTLRFATCRQERGSTARQLKPGRAAVAEPCP